MTRAVVRENMNEDDKTIAAATITHGPAYQRYLATLTTAQETK